MQKPPPCYQDWDAMAKVPGGRICAQCDNTIVDFSKKTWEDILKIQKASQFSTCGKYSKKQIRHWGHQPPVVDLAWFRKLSFTGLLVLLGLRSVDAKLSVKVLTEKVDLDFTSSSSQKRDSNTVKFKGSVVDSTTKEPLAGVVILPILGEGGSYTDENGNFTYKVNKPLSNADSIEVNIKYIGYADLKLFLYKNKNNIIEISDHNYVIPKGIIFRVEEPGFKLKPIRTIKNWFRKD